MYANSPFTVQVHTIALVVKAWHNTCACASVVACVLSGSVRIHACMCVRI